MTTHLPPLDECESRFWSRYGPRLYGQARKPQTAQEWHDAAVMTRGLLRLDEVAERLERAEENSRARVASERRRNGS